VYKTLANVTRIGHKQQFTWKGNSNYTTSLYICRTESHCWKWVELQLC